MTWLTTGSVLLIGGALVAAQAAPAYQACAPMLPGPLPSNRVVNLNPGGAYTGWSSLIGANEVIVVGRLDSQVCRVETPFARWIDAPIVQTKFTVVVESALRGSAPEARLSVIFHGLGRVVTPEGALQTETDGLESPKVGDRVLLFLKPDAVEADAFAITASRQGIFRLIGDTTIRSPWRGIVKNSPASIQAQLDGKKTADVLAEVARIIGREVIGALF